MSNGNTTCITQAGDTWTLIASKAYNDVNQVQMIIQANPYVSMVEVFDAGVVLLIPILDPPSVNTNNLPPWKR